MALEELHMMNARVVAGVALVIGCCGGTAHAVGIHPTAKYAWSSQTGWQNYSPTHGGATVVPDGANGYLAGYVWTENAGWINFESTHSQVTVDTTTGRFDGMAWSENLGWVAFRDSNWAYNVRAAFANIAPTGKYAWSSQTGWQNYSPTHGGTTVVPDGANGYLAGYVWAENVGWIKLGSGAGPYANTGPTDWGVNMDAAGNLSGYAWSSQAGWINFDSAHSQVTVDVANGQFSGEAWGENIGWVSFRDTNPAYGVRTTFFDVPPNLAPTVILFQ
jgi:hypothetical protein